MGLVKESGVEQVVHRTCESRDTGFRKRKVSDEGYTVDSSVILPYRQSTSESRSYDVNFAGNLIYIISVTPHTIFYENKQKKTFPRASCWVMHVGLGNISLGAKSLYVE